MRKAKDVGRNRAALLTAFMSTAVAACVSAPTPSEETSYNRGVAAYRVKNYSVAAADWEQAVTEREPTAANNLAYLLYDGLGVKADRGRAVALWQSAAVSGVSESQWHLGNEYATGGVVVRDRAQAYGWYRCAVENATRQAARQADDTESKIAADARESLVKLIDDLTADDLEHGKALAQFCISNYVFPNGPISLPVAGASK